MKRTILLSTLFFVPTCLFAQQPDCLHRTIAVSVVDEKDAPIAGLTAENFRGSFRGAPVKIVSAKFDARPIKLVILLDLSGSMALGSKLRVAQFIVADALSSAPAGSQVALITISDKAKIYAGLLQDKQAMSDLMRDVNRMDRTSLKGGTALWDAVGAAVKLLSPPQPGDVVYAVTDGGDTASYMRKPDAVAALLDAGLRFFAFLVPDDDRRDMAAQRRVGRKELSELAEMTGGKVLNLPPAGPLGSSIEYNLSPNGQKRISDAASLLYVRMQQFYLVEIELSKEVDNPRSWKLKLLANEGPLKKASLYYPKTLLPCSSPSGNRP
jgi:Mg-chelatase subunit ChlD